MAHLQTTACRLHRHPEFRISYDPALVPVKDDVLWFVNWLESSVAGGERFADGQTCEVGWMILQIRMDAAGFLTLWEPDMQELPIAWVESVSQTLAHLRLQKDICESVLPAGLARFPSLLQSVIICNRVGRSETLVMERILPNGERDSGWYCGCSGDEHDHNNVEQLLKVSLYEAAVRYSPRIVPYLALPEGILLQAGGDRPRIFRDGELLDFKPGSYLASLYRV